jgi:hypothetical protein
MDLLTAPLERSLTAAHERIESLEQDVRTLTELADRVDALEARKIQLSDLPLRHLMAKLEQDWQPDAVLLASSL